MAIVTYPLNDIDYTAEDAELYNCTRTSGIYAMNHFPISIALNSSNQFVVSIGPGIAWINNKDDSDPSVISFNGKVVGNKDTVNYNGFSADGTYPRIDRIILRFSKSNGRTEFYRLVGTAASTPSPRALTKTEDVYELGLYDILIPASATAVSQLTVTDLRADPSLCGLMRDGIDSLNPAPVGKTVDIATGDWSGSSSPWTAIKSVSGVAAGKNVIVSGSDGSMETWSECGVYAASLGTNSITFKALFEKPASTVKASIIILD